jgi:hypothetical protein
MVKSDYKILLEWGFIRVVPVGAGATFLLRLYLYCWRQQQ